MSQPVQKKTLRLVIEVPDVWADDLDDLAGYLSEPNDATDDDRLDVVLEEWFYPTAGLTLVAVPGDKCQNSEFTVHGYNVQIVGAHTVDRKRSGRSVPVTEEEKT